MISQKVAIPETASTLFSWDDDLAFSLKSLKSRSFEKLFGLELEMIFLV